MATTKFFYCFDLETAGIFFGWTGLLSSSFSAMLLTVIFCLEFHNIVQFRSDFETDNIPQSVYVFIVLFIIVFLYVILILKFWVSKSLLDGTKSRQSKLVKRWYDFHIFSSILFCIVIIRIPILILILVFDIYIIVCIKELHDKFKSEEDHQVEEQV